MRLSLRICLVLLLATAAVFAGCTTPMTNTTQNSTAHANASLQPQAARLVLLTEEYAPLNYLEDGRAHGVSIDLLNETLQRLGTGQSVDEVRFLPWSVAYNQTLAENNTVLFATERIPSREALFKWAGPIHPEPAVLFGLRDRTLTITSAADLQGYRIGAVRDDSALQKLRDLGVPESALRITEDPLTLVSWLDAGEVDLFAYGEVPGWWLAVRAGMDQGRLHPVFTLDEFESYFAFNRNTSDETVARFQAALDRLSVDRDVDNLTVRERILRLHIPRVGLAGTVFLTEEYPPLNTGVNGTIEGIAPDLLRLIFERADLTLRDDQVRLTTWPEAYRTALEQNDTAVFSTARSPDRENLFAWAGPIARLQYVVLADRDRAATAGSDLAQYRIATVRNDTAATYLRDAGVPDGSILYETDPAALVDAVRAGRADAIAYPLITTRSLLTRAGLDPNRFVVARTLGERDMYVAFNRNVSPNTIRMVTTIIADLKNRKDASGLSQYERILYRYSGVQCSMGVSNLTGARAVVNLAADRMAADTAGALREISAGRPPFRDAGDPELYAFVYDMNLTVVAHPNALLLGENFATTTDVTGRPFRDELRSVATTKGSGWVDYVYVNVNQSHLSQKTTYCRLVRGSDGRDYIVCAGTFRSCDS